MRFFYLVTLTVISFAMGITGMDNNFAGFWVIILREARGHLKRQFTILEVTIFTLAQHVHVLILNY